MKGVVVTCVYCGSEYPAGTPTAGSGILTEHIRVCVKHPLRKAEFEIAMLRSALVRIIGSDDADELRKMRSAIAEHPDHPETANLLPAIDALLYKA